VRAATVPAVIFDPRLSPITPSEPSHQATLCPRKRV
jgi:hypothetical protein